MKPGEIVLKTRHPIEPKIRPEATSGKKNSLVSIMMYLLESEACNTINYNLLN